jgi:DNA repair exonuclease SbcCD ATPase subunit
MRLLEVEVRHWRGLSAKLGEFSPRLNLILGPNEAGKSRLFQALRYGLFESYKGTAQHKQQLQSWSSADSPFVRILLDVNGTRYEIQKQFLKGASAQFAGGGATLRNEEAEEALRRLLGAQQAGNRGASVADMGIWPLLMVSQGESRRPVQEDLNEEGRGRLQDRLSAEIGVAAISPAAQRLMALAEAEYGRYFTATGQDSKSLRDARARHAEAVAVFDAASAALNRQEQTASALAENVRELTDLEARGKAARQEAEAARGRAEAAQQAASRVGVAQGEVRSAAQKVHGIADVLRTRLEADAAVERLTAEISAVETQLAERTAVQRGLDDDLNASEGAVKQAEEVLRARRIAVDAVKREQRRAELTGALEEIGARIADVERIEAAIGEVRAARASLPPVDAKCLSRLKALDQDARAAAAQLQGAAVSVVVHLKQPAAIDGAAHDAGEQIEIEVTENRRIAIGSLADVEIRPGGGELSSLRESKAAADNALADGLRELGLKDMAHAAEIHTALADADRKLSGLVGESKALSAKSLQRLREDRSRVAAELDRLGPPVAHTEASDAGGGELGHAEDAVAAARSRRDAASGAHSLCRTETATLQGKATAKRQECESIKALYAERPTAEALRLFEAAAVAERERAQARLSTATREFDDLGGEGVQADARRLTVAADGLDGRVRKLRSEVDRLKGVLQGLMADGHYETVQQADAVVEQAKLDLERLERQAAAVRSLWETLRDERRKVVERLTAPVTLRVKPYLQDLFPGSSLDAGEALEVVGLQSGDLKEPYEALSGGAQEQISVLTRIGLAEVLAGEGTLPLILDDVLINTDPDRIKRMHRVLYRAADKLQILLFSCHDVLFDGLGAEYVVTLKTQRQGSRAT